MTAYCPGATLSPMEPEVYTQLDSAGDVRLRLRAGDLAGLLRAALRGFLSLVTDPASVRPVDRIEVRLEAPDREDLLVAWLNELVFLLDTREFLPAGADIRLVSGTNLEATLHGEEMVPDRHERRLLVKAATYHGLYVRALNGGLEGEVTLDL